MGKCTVCGKEMDYKADKCGDCAKKSLQDIFAKNPELKQAFKETVHEMGKPENMKKMVDNTCKFMDALNKIRK